MGKRKEIPPDAKLVFQGQIFDVWQWNQKMYDGSTAIFERLQRTDTVRIIATVGEKIVIEYQEQPDSFPFISLPAGRVNKNEDVKIAAQRELLEETGFVCDDWKLWQALQPQSKIIWTVYTFLAKDCNLKQKPNLECGEKIRTELVTFDDFLTLSENPEWTEQDLNVLMVKARYDKKFKEKLKKIIF